MKRQAYQHPELRDANDNIIQQGTYGKESPLVNSDNTGVLDYINNNLEALYDNLNGARIYVANKAALPATGDLSAMYIAEDTGKWYLWDGQKYTETDNARKIADEAIAARDAAKASANDAANSAREQQADWNVTDTTSKAYIKNKPEVLTYQTPKWKEPSKWEDNTIQSIAQAFPDDHPAAYAYGVKVTLGRIKNEEGHTNLYFPHNGGMCLKSYWGSDSNTSGWLTMLTDQNYSNFALPKNGTAVKATADAAGNNIQSTYAKKSDLTNYLPLSGGTMTTGDTLITMGNGESYVRNWGNGLYLGGTNKNNASSLILFTNSNASGFQLQAGNGTAFKRMTGKPDGTLTWDNKEIERVSAKGTYGIRLESGIQLCWGELTIPDGTPGREVSGTMTFQYPFANTNYVLTFGNDWCASSSEYYRAEGRNTANFKFTAVGVGKNCHKAFYIAIGYWK